MVAVGTGIGMNIGIASGGGGTPPPSAPTGVVLAVLASALRVSWNAVGGATSYNLYRGTTPGGEALLTTGVTSPTDDATVVADTMYYYTVTAVGPGGESAQSAEVSGKTAGILDNFTGTNGTSLAAHTIAPNNGPGTAWTILSGALEIQSNRVSQTFNGFNKASVDFGVADCTLKVIINDTGAGQNSYGGLMARASDANNFWAFVLASTTTLSIIEVVAGSYTVRANGSFSITPFVDCVLEFVLNGSTLTGKANGTEIVTYGSATSNQTVTKHGIHGYFTFPAWVDVFDDFQVTT